MKKLTKGQRFALAREARRLAMECVDGTAPKLVSWSWCNCACGEVVTRAGMGADIARHADIAEWIDLLVPAGNSYGLVSTALMVVPPEDAHAAVVFPLLAMADELEAAGASKTPSDLKAEVP